MTPDSSCSLQTTLCASLIRDITTSDHTTTIDTGGSMDRKRALVLVCCRLSISARRLRDGWVNFVLFRTPGLLRCLLVVEPGWVYKANRIVRSVTEWA